LAPTEDVGYPEAPKVPNGLPSVSTSLEGEPLSIGPDLTISAQPSGVGRARVGSEGLVHGPVTGRLTRPEWLSLVSGVVVLAACSMGRPAAPSASSHVVSVAMSREGVAQQSPC
jgi:hypothetical protein